MTVRGVLFDIGGVIVTEDTVVEQVVGDAFMCAEINVLVGAC